MSPFPMDDVYVLLKQMGNYSVIKGSLMVDVLLYFISNYNIKSYYNPPDENK
jgi:hypothetical protein